MKDILKGVTVKIISVIVMIALIVGGGCFAYKYYIGKITNKTGHEVVNSIEVVKEKLETAAELNTGSYLCTDVITWEDSKKFKDWKIPFTDKSFIVQYDGCSCRYSGPYKGRGYARGKYHPCEAAGCRDYGDRD